MFDIQYPGFVTRLEAVIGRPLDSYEHEMLLSSLKVERPLSVESAIKYGDDPRGLYTEYIPLEHAAARYAEKKIGHWLYDRRLKLWLINMNLGAHEGLMGTLYGIYNNNIEDGWAEELAEQYILQQYGFYVSASMRLYIPIKADDCILTPEEAIFEKAKGSLAWRSI